MAVKTKTQKQVNTLISDLQPLEQSPAQSVLTKDQIETENFKLEELEYTDKIPDSLLPNAQKLLQNLQILRSILKRPVKIIPGGGYRSQETNAKVKGAKESKHLLCQASDIRVEGLTPHQVHETIEKLISEGKMSEGGLGLYSTFVHYDVRGERARWNG